jgi:hypothetical protein
MTALDDPGVYPKVYLMPTIATKLSTELAHQVRHAANARKITVSTFVRLAVEHELAGREGETLGAKFGHLFGVAGRLPSDASRKEGYED